ncbi:M20 family metallopeptidase [Paenibacillus thermoaerophilus]|uniref:M20 family metallopeptidase n=1 Tax=Paenibacillus thermoaerophilus TaxID=1215385 RepID=A0ABW2V0L4_9BACL|nr:M20 family metallopeptidase [Paenibacillus thermoaerophilus]TMV17360.1 amidohydrolase [Paenibacillus thermoaerophilus]
MSGSERIRLLEEAAGRADKWIEFRRDLHRYPELSFEEAETAAKVRRELDRLGIPYRSGVGGHGIVAELNGAESGPTIALRADMDALPIQEESGAPFASERPGVMHACGHDAHTAILLGAAELLASRRPARGSIRLLFQSAEEINAGAKAMIAEGALDGVDEIYGLHNLPTLPAGLVATRRGALMGSVDRLELTLTGRGGHGAIPNETIDPIVCASALVMGLQTAVSRELSPFEPAVVTIGSLQAGHANNVIPHRAELTGTVRAFDPAVQAKLPGIIKRLVEGIAYGYRCQADLRYMEQVPVLVNHDAQAAFVEAATDALIGRERRVEAAPTMAGEDFSVYLKHVPGCFFWLGSGPRQGAENAYGLHHPQYTLNEECIPLGAALLASLALDRLNHI